MTDHGFTTTFTVDRTPMEAFDAVIDARGWWSEEIDGPTDQPGAEFTYHYEDVHRCRIQVTEAVPGRKVSWLVVDNYFDFTEDKTEWIGTTISFDISDEDGKTEVRLTHQGLVPAYECFEVCSTAWDFYAGSLRSLITTGEGQPNGRGRPRLPLEEAAAGQGR
ncbi:MULTISPECIES: SRPBCC family protein [Nonomuraea]|uniref:SRPBCC domain-containing protein n=1 Tax=Nonomuraea mangrovi TaxID=2316207 RepID=A0ABW4TB62_9ACTN